jgi:hypothetical protein
VTPEDTVPHNVVDYVNVLCGWADSTMLEKGTRGLVICIHGNNRDREAKVLEDLPQPQCFLGGGAHCIVFSLTSGLRYYALELGLPRDRTTVLAVYPSSGGFPAINVTSTIRITVALEGYG